MMTYMLAVGHRPDVAVAIIARDSNHNYIFVRSQDGSLRPLGGLVEYNYTPEQAAARYCGTGIFADPHNPNFDTSKFYLKFLEIIHKDSAELTTTFHDNSTFTEKGTRYTLIFELEETGDELLDITHLATLEEGNEYVALATEEATEVAPEIYSRYANEHDPNIIY